MNWFCVPIALFGGTCLAQAVSRLSSTQSASSSTFRDQSGGSMLSRSCLPSCWKIPKSQLLLTERFPFYVGSRAIQILPDLWRSSRFEKLGLSGGAARISAFLVVRVVLQCVLWVLCALVAGWLLVGSVSTQVLGSAVCSWRRLVHICVPAWALRRGNHSLHRTSSSLRSARVPPHWRFPW